MFNLQGSELIIVLLLALVVLGPEKLPDAMRRAGKAYAELKKMSSGFQSEFRAAVEEPLREIRETANVLRDSADFTKLQDGERKEKPKSAEMAPGDPDAVPTEQVPDFETPTESGPRVAPDSAASPFDDDQADDDQADDDQADDDDESSDLAADIAPVERSGRREMPGSTPVTAPAPFTGMSSAAPTQQPPTDRTNTASAANGSTRDSDDAATDTTSAGIASAAESDGEPPIEPRRPFTGRSSAAPRPVESAPADTDDRPPPQDRNAEQQAVEDRNAEEHAVEEQAVEDRNAEERAVEDRAVEDRNAEEQAVEDRPSDSAEGDR